MDEMGIACKIGNKRRLTVKNLITNIKILQKIQSRRMLFTDAARSFYNKNNRHNARREYNDFVQGILQEIGIEGEIEFLSEGLDGTCILNDVGQVLMDHASDVVSAYDRMKEDLKFYLDKGVVNLRIGSIETIANSLLPNIVEQFSKMHPNTKINIKTGTSYEIKQWLDTYKVDVGVVTESDLSKYYSKQLVEEFPVYICSEEKYQEFERSKQKIEEMPFIYFCERSSWRRRMDNWIRERKEPLPKMLFEIDNMEVILYLVNSNVGWSIVPNTTVNKTKYTNIHIYQHIEEQLNTYVISRNNPRNLVKEFVEYCGA